MRRAGGDFGEGRTSLGSEGYVWGTTGEGSSMGLLLEPAGPFRGLRTSLISSASSWLMVTLYNGPKVYSCNDLNYLIELLLCQGS